MYIVTVIFNITIVEGCKLSQISGRNTDIFNPLLQQHWAVSVPSESKITVALIT